MVAVAPLPVPWVVDGVAVEGALYPDIGQGGRGQELALDGPRRRRRTRRGCRGSRMREASGNSYRRRERRIRDYGRRFAPSGFLQMASMLLKQTASTSAVICRPLNPDGWCRVRTRFPRQLPVALARWRRERLGCCRRSPRSAPQPPAPAEGRRRVSPAPRIASGQRLSRNLGNRRGGRARLPTLKGSR